MYGMALALFLLAASRNDAPASAPVATSKRAAVAA